MNWVQAEGMRRELQDWGSNGTSRWNRLKGFPENMVSTGRE
jgi:hypothetical protein